MIHILLDGSSIDTDDALVPPAEGATKSVPGSIMLQRWDECLISTILAIPSTPNDATGYSPSILLYVTR